MYMYSVYRGDYVFSCSLRYWNVPEAVCYWGRLANPRSESSLRAPPSATPVHIWPQLFRFSGLRGIQLLAAALPLRPLVFLNSTWNSENEGFILQDTHFVTCFLIKPIAGKKDYVKLAEVGVICSMRLNFSHSKSGKDEKTLDLLISFFSQHIFYWLNNFF